ncbi:MAG: YhbY family RNA-binding protein [Peptococcaceae bacterium]|jgi:RNA-binding protein
MKLSKKDIKELKAQAQELKPKVLVGKNGLNEGTLQSIDEVLEADELAKIKFLNNSIEITQEMCEELAEELQAELVQKIGRMIILYREKIED